MTARRLRESPRLVAAGTILGAVLVLVGVIIGLAAAGGGGTPAPQAHAVVAAAPRPAGAAPAAGGGAAGASAVTVSRLRAQVATDDATIARLRASLVRTRHRLTAARRTARAAAAHPHRARNPHTAKTRR